MARVRETIGFGAKHEDLPKFLIGTFKSRVYNSTPKKNAASRVRSADDAGTRLLQRYRAFLLKDLWPNVDRRGWR